MNRWLLLSSLVGCVACGEVRAIDDDAPAGPAFRVVSFQELGLVPQPGAVQGRDAALSAVLWGKAVWTYATTVLNMNAADGTNWHNNSFSTTDDLTGNDGVKGFVEQLDAAGTPIRLLTATPDEAAYNANHAGAACPIAPCGVYYDTRPSAPLWDAARNRALILYELGFFQAGGLQTLGRSIATWSSLDTAPDRPQVSQGDHPTLVFVEGEPAFGSAAQVVDNDLYAFACAPDAGRFASPCKLAKVPLAEALVRSSWRFWDGQAFSSVLADAAELFTGNSVMTVAWNPHIQQFLALYSEPLTNVIMARSAPRLTGPWSDQVMIFKTPAPAADRWTFDAALHDAYTENGGQTLYVTYSRPNPSNGVYGDEVAWVRVDIAAIPR